MPQTFPNIAPSMGSSKNRTYNVRRTNFGDGYQQRVADGLNHKRDSWSLTWEGLTDTDADSIETFLDARAGHESFYWTPPNGSQGLYTCDGYARTEDGPSHATVNAQFVQAFDL